MKNIKLKIIIYIHVYIENLINIFVVNLTMQHGTFSFFLILDDIV